MLERSNYTIPGYSMQHKAKTLKKIFLIIFFFFPGTLGETDCLQNKKIYHRKT